MKIIKLITFFVALLITQRSGYAQSMRDTLLNNQISYYVTLLNNYPYNKIFVKIGSPDTLIFFQYPLSNDKNDQLPKSLELFIYKRNGIWHGCSIICFSKHCNKCKIWIMMKPIALENRIFDDNINKMLYEFGLIDYSNDLSIYHTSIFFKQGKEMSSAWIIGDLRDFSSSMPETACVLSMCYLASINMKVIKTFKSWER